MTRATVTRAGKLPPAAQRIVGSKLGRSVEVPRLVLEEALDALLVRVRWYATRGYPDSTIPESVNLAFNYLATALEKPDAPPYTRFRR